MLKPPEGLLAGVPGIDGTTLLGDGRVLIVLDLQEIFGSPVQVSSMRAILSPNCS